MTTTTKTTKPTTARPRLVKPGKTQTATTITTDPVPPDDGGQKKTTASASADANGRESMSSPAGGGQKKTADSTVLTSYTVVAGDTLSKIAQRLLGSGQLFPLIFEANRPLLTDPNLIHPGQVLTIPAIPVVEK
jgi:nucleoid-associated protein YgaU